MLPKFFQMSQDTAVLFQSVQRSQALAIYEDSNSDLQRVGVRCRGSMKRAPDRDPRLRDVRATPPGRLARAGESEFLIAPMNYMELNQINKYVYMYISTNMNILNTVVMRTGMRTSHSLTTTRGSGCTRTTSACWPRRMLIC